MEDSGVVANSLVSQRFYWTLATSENVVEVFLDGCPGLASAWPQCGEAGRGGEGDAAQAHVQAVDLGGDGHLAEEAAIPRQPG